MNTLDQLFVGDLVLGVPEVSAEMNRKMPGDADGDNKGDHCA